MYNTNLNIWYNAYLQPISYVITFKGTYFLSKVPHEVNLMNDALLELGPVVYEHILYSIQIDF